MFRVHSVSQRPNLRHLGEALGGAESLLVLIASKTLSVAINRQHSSAFPLLSHCLPVFDEIRETEMDYILFASETQIKIANTQLYRSVVLVLSVIN